jgi:hypothetical protein
MLRAACSTVLLISEGANRYCAGDKRQRFRMAQGECGECAAASELAMELGLVPTHEALAVQQLATPAPYPHFALSVDRAMRSTAREPGPARPRSVCGGRDRLQQYRVCRCLWTATALSMTVRRPQPAATVRVVPRAAGGRPVLEVSAIPDPVSGAAYHGWCCTRKARWVVEPFSRLGRNRLET